MNRVNVSNTALKGGDEAVATVSSSGETYLPGAEVIPANATDRMGRRKNSDAAVASVNERVLVTSGYGF